MALRRRTASSFVLVKDEDVREKKRKVGVVDAGDPADDAVVRGSCLARKDIMVQYFFVRAPFFV